MSAPALGRRYGRALLELATEAGNVDAVQGELDSVNAAWSSSEELREVFENPNVASAARRAIITGIATKLGVSKTVKNTLCLMSDGQRMRYLPDVVSGYRALAEKRAGRVRAEVTTATDMPDAYFAQLKVALEKVTKQEVTIEKRTDPSLMGGVVTRVGDQVFDGSLKTRLDELQDTLLNR